MQRESLFITVGEEQLHYLKTGNGRKLLLAFHGYGNDAGIFELFNQYLGQEYIILSFDLPHHGKSKWEGAHKFTRQGLQLMTEQLMQQYGVSKISLLGYSIGGRLCLSIIERMPVIVEKATLLASDGLSINLYYYFFTRTHIGKRIFLNLTDRPKNYIKVIGWLKRGGLINDSVHKLVTYYLQDEASRNQLKNGWPALSDIMPPPGKVKAMIKQYHIPVAIFMGLYDKIIPHAIAQKFQSGLDSVQLRIVEKGHRLLDNETIKDIAQTLL